jgi:murein DD-endopeptidase MepM/ murein hydrolase activator NlpD
VKRPFVAGLVIGAILLVGFLATGLATRASGERRPVPGTTTTTVPARTQQGATVPQTVPQPEATPTPSPAFDQGDLEVLTGRHLAFPVKDWDVAKLIDTFTESRGTHPHDALDILAPRGTPVLAVDDGIVKRLFTSVRGGLTVYQFDPTESYCYYYAHLDHYADGIVEGRKLQKGDLIGYVGTTGNAPPQTPHLHFTIFKLGPERRWWEGAALNPFTLYKGR